MTEPNKKLPKVSPCHKAPLRIHYYGAPKNDFYACTQCDKECGAVNNEGLDQNQQSKCDGKNCICHLKSPSICLYPHTTCEHCHPNSQEHNPIKTCECGGAIETHQGNNGFPDSWYCLSCGKDFDNNPFKIASSEEEIEHLELTTHAHKKLAKLGALIDSEDLANDLLENWKERYAHNCGDPKCYSFSYDEIQKLLDLQAQKSKEEGRREAYEEFKNSKLVCDCCFKELQKRSNS